MDAQTWDAFDFFSVSLTVVPLSKTFGKSKTDITWGITLVLMFRSVGSIVFGIASDRYGRKWPFIINNLLFIVLELVSYNLTQHPCQIFLALGLLRDLQDLSEEGADTISGHWILPNLSTILGLQGIVWHRHGRSLWQCRCYSPRRYP
jgi:MFS family permease